MTNGTPTIDRLDPAEGDPAGAFRVDMYGTNLNLITGVRWNNAALGFTIYGTTQIVVQAPAGPPATWIPIVLMWGPAGDQTRSTVFYYLGGPPPSPGVPLGRCARSAWLTLGDLVVPLEDSAAGYVCPSLDLGFPEVRDVVDTNPDRDGLTDRTRLVGGRTVTAEIAAFAPGAVIDAIPGLFAPFMNPAARPALHYMLDRPGQPERVITGLRAAGFAWPIVGADERDLQLQWIASDPIARDPATRAVTAWSGSSTQAGRTYPLTFNRIYPAGGGYAVAGIIRTEGDVAIRPLYRIYGPVTGPTVQISTSPVVGLLRFLSTFTVGAGQWVDVDSDSKTIWLNGDPTTPAATSLDWQASRWPVIPPQTNVTLQLFGSSTSGVTQVQAIWQDGYLT